MSRLVAEDLTVTYGGLQAVADVSLAVGEGEIVGLIGPNGAGKTSFIDAISGFTKYTGSVTLDGHSLDGMRPDQRVHAGLARTWQTADVFDELTVRENLRAAAYTPSLRSTMRELFTGRLEPVRAVDDVLGLLGLDELADQRPDELSQGQRKLVDVARALAGGPEVVCLDEPAAGLDTAESQVLASHLREVVRAGTSILLVDHDMGLVLSVCDRIYVLDFGRLIATGTPEEISRSEQVLEAYLGETGADAVPAGALPDVGGLGIEEEADHA